MKRVRSIVASSIAAMLFAGCGGSQGGGSVVPGATTPQQQPPYTGPTTLANFGWDNAILSDSQYIGPADDKIVISMTAAVTMQNEAGLLQYAHDVSDPSSASYRRFLTPSEIGNRFGASQSDYASTAAYFHSYGISAGGWPQRLALALSGTTGAFSKALGTSFGWYRYGTQTFLAPHGTPHFTKALPVRSFLGLANNTRNKSYFIRISNGQTTGMSPQQLAKGFDFSGAYSAGFTGTGINVGIIGTGPIDTAPGNDVATLAKAYRTAAAPVSIVPAVAHTASPVNGNTGTGAYDVAPGGLATPPPVTGTCVAATPAPGFSFAAPDYTKCNPEDGEAQLDTESVATLAPGSNVLFYLAYNNGTCVDPNGNFTPAANGKCPTGQIIYQQEGIQLTDDEIQQAIADNTADILSLSFGLGENGGVGYYYNASGSGIGPSEFAALAAEGIAVFASSGDTGNQSCFTSTGPLATPCVSYPASDPSVTGVGGVNIPLDNTGNVIGQITAWADQTTVGGDGTFRNNVGSGGGVSQIFNAPSYQNGLTVPTGSNPASQALGGKRGVPDVSLDADPASGPSIAFNIRFGGGFGASGGTSAAAPQMAAMWSLVLQACKASASCATGGGAHPYRLGNPNALLYKLVNGKLNGLGYSNVFYDVQYGQNQANKPGTGPTPGPPITGCCTAGVGYDLVTGLGVPMGGHLIQAMTGTAAP